MTLKEITIQSTQLLKKSNFISSPALEARILICSILHIDLKKFFLNLENHIINDIELQSIQLLVSKRIAGRSIASIIGYQEFYDCQFFVDDSVLIPRPDTEIIVEQIIKIVHEKKLSHAIDIGTGPGTIAISVARHCKELQIDAFDISRKALELCAKNIQFNIPDNTTINIFEADIAHYTTTKKYDLIMSNPPYIPSNVVTEILSNHTVDDPVISLDGGITGLELYHAIKRFAQKSLIKGGIIILEHGYDQKNAMIEIFNNDGFVYKECIVDYGQNDRGCIIERL